MHPISMSFHSTTVWVFVKQRLFTHRLYVHKELAAPSGRDLRESSRSLQAHRHSARSCTHRPTVVVSGEGLFRVARKRNGSVSMGTAIWHGGSPRQRDPHEISEIHSSVKKRLIEPGFNANSVQMRVRFIHWPQMCVDAAAQGRL